jgi:hypothetical protein
MSVALAALLTWLSGKGTRPEILRHVSSDPMKVCRSRRGPNTEIAVWSALPLAIGPVDGVRVLTDQMELQSADVVIIVVRGAWLSRYPALI